MGLGGPIIGADSRLDVDTVTVSPTENASFPKANLTDDRVFTIFKWSTTGTLDIITDTGGSSAPVDYLGIVGHDLFTQGASFVFANSSDNISYTTLVSATPTTDRIILKTFTSASNRFFRLRITGAAAVPSIGQVSWGVSVLPPFNLAVGFDPLRENVSTSDTRSQTGNIMGVVHTFTTKVADVRLRLMPQSFIRDEVVGGFQHFWLNHARLKKPFFWNWSIDCNFEVDAFFAIMDSDPRRPLVTPNCGTFHDLNFRLIGQGED